MVEPEGLFNSSQLLVVEDPQVDGGIDGSTKKGSFSLTSNLQSLQSRDGANHLDYLSTHYNSMIYPCQPYRSLDFIVVSDQNDENKVQLSLPFVERGKAWEPRAVNAEGGKLYSMTTATSDIEKMIDKKLSSLDDPYFVPFTGEEIKDAGATLRSARSGDQFFEMCNKAWERISRATMKNEWLQEIDDEGQNTFNFESTLCEYNNEHVGIQYPKEWQNEDILPVREDGVIEKSEIQEPITISRKRQLIKLRKLARLLSKRRDEDQKECENTLYAQMCLFTHSMQAAQDALDECCKQSEGTKAKTSAYKDYLVCLQPEDVFGPQPSRVMSEIFNAEVERVFGKKTEPEEHNYASLRISQELIDRYTAPGDITPPLLSTYSDGNRGKLQKMDENKAREYIRNFYAAHNRNVENFCALLTPEKRNYTKYSSVLPNISSRLHSDLLIRQAIAIRIQFEEEFAAMRHELYSTNEIVNVKDRLVARGVKDGWKGIEALQKELDDYNLQHLDKINEKIAKRVSKANQKLEYVPTDTDLKVWNERSIKRRVRLNNENGVPHNLRYGKWYFGRVHTFKGNITCSPVAGIPALPSKHAINSEAALQYAFLTNFDMHYALHNCATISHSYEGCSALFNLAKGMAYLQVSVGADTLEKSVPLPSAFYDAKKVTTIVLKWTSRSNDYLGDEGDV